MRERFTPAYRAVIGFSVPIVRIWGRMKVTGAGRIPLDGPLLIAGNHDSYWDPVAVGVAARKRRQIRALAKSSLWGNAAVGAVLTGMGQIPIDRGKGDAGAMDRAVEELRAGACIGVFPEGTRSLGRELRARSGLGRLAEAVPGVPIVCVAIQGTVDVPRFPRRPRISVDFFLPSGGGLQPGEAPGDLPVRLLAELRGRAPRSIAGRKRRKAAAAPGAPG